MSRLYVANISSKANMDEVHELFLDHGKLKSFNIQNGSGYIVTLSLTYAMRIYRSTSRPSRRRKPLRNSIRKKYVDRASWWSLRGK